eukprot:1662573-Pleurochrysis_carterae.AAC.2
MWTIRSMQQLHSEAAAPSASLKSEFGRYYGCGPIARFHLAAARKRLVVPRSGTLRPSIEEYAEYCARN